MLGLAPDAFGNDPEEDQGKKQKLLPRYRESEYEEGYLWEPSLFELDLAAQVAGQEYQDCCPPGDDDDKKKGKGLDYTKKINDGVGWASDATKKTAQKVGKNFDKLQKQSDKFKLGLKYGKEAKKVSRIWKIAKIAGRISLAASIMMSGAELYSSGYTNEGWAKFITDMGITGVSYIPGIGLPAAIILGVTNEIEPLYAPIPGKQ